VSGGLVPREDAAWFLKNHPGAFSSFEIFKIDPDFRWNMGMGMRKADQGLIDVLTATIGQMQLDGTLEGLLNKYGISYQPPFPEIPPPPRESRLMQLDQDPQAGRDESLAGP
jgi:ABC-type amino acid transport substrate-binding protein